MKKTYTASLNGSKIGTRKTERTYTHAVIIQHSEDFARQQAESVEHAKTWCSKKAFAYEQAKADGSDLERALREFPTIADHLRARAPAEQAAAQAIVDMGYDAWVEQRRQRNIADFLARTFQPGVVCWCGRPDLANKEANKYCGRPEIANVWIVDAVELVKA